MFVRDLLPCIFFCKVGVIACEEAGLDLFLILVKIDTVKRTQENVLPEVIAFEVVNAHAIKEVNFACENMERVDSLNVVKDGSEEDMEKIRKF